MPNELDLSLRVDGDLFGEIVFEEFIDEHRDAYVIGFVRDLNSDGMRLTSHYLNHREQFIRDIHHYPFTLTGLKRLAIYDVAVRQFVQQLDPLMLESLIDANMDHLAAYALLHNYPELKQLIDKPLLLMAAYLRLYRFEKLDIPAPEDYRQWFPQLFFQETLTSAVYRALDKIDTTSPKLAVSAADYIIRNFPKLHRLLSTVDQISPIGLRESIFLINSYPQLLRSRWFSLSLIRNKDQALGMRNLLYHTELLLRQAGITNWEQTLYRQPESIEQVRRMHDRYIPQPAPFSSMPVRLIWFPTFGLKNTETCSVVRTSRQLVEIANELNNCARIFIDLSHQGLLLHVYYESGYDKGLLQIDTRDSSRPEITEFSGPRNLPVTNEAWDAVAQWIEKAVPISGKIARAALLHSYTKARSKTKHVGEPYFPYHQHAEPLLTNADCYSNKDG